MFYSVLQLVVVGSMQPSRATNVAQQNSITFLKTLWCLYVVCFVCNAIVQFSKLSFVPQCQQRLKVSCHMQRSRLNYVVIQRNPLSFAWGCSRTGPWVLRNLAKQYSTFIWEGVSGCDSFWASGVKQRPFPVWVDLYIQPVKRLNGRNSVSAWPFEMGCQCLLAVDPACAQAETYI